MQAERRPPGRVLGFGLCRRVATTTSHQFRDTSSFVGSRELEKRKEKEIIIKREREENWPQA